MINASTLRKIKRWRWIVHILFCFIPSCPCSVADRCQNRVLIIISGGITWCVLLKMLDLPEHFHLILWPSHHSEIIYETKTSYINPHFVSIPGACWTIWNCFSWTFSFIRLKVLTFFNQSKFVSFQCLQFSQFI